MAIISNKKNKTKSFFAITAILGSLIIPQNHSYSKTYLTINQAKNIMFDNKSMKKIDVIISKEQIKNIYKASNTRVRSNKMNVWRVSDGGWFIVDNVIGKHENIDFAISLDKNGKIRDIEILVYRETYGGEIMNPKWLAQFFGTGNEKKLKLDDDIKNISGATLSCRNLTDGVNRITESWNQVLRYL
jgi:Na+-translocating ferredoxin:NAD+ oxidoreductase RnfG subunit